MGTRFEKRVDGKINKPPYSVAPGDTIHKAAKNDPEMWTTFGNALAALERGYVDAIGYVFMESDPFFTVDLDKCIDIETGEINEAATEIVHNLGTYTELSCSGKGLHAIGVGKKPVWSGTSSDKMGTSVEVYDSSAFIVMTGKRISAQTELEDRQGKLEWLCQRLWIKAERLFNRPPAESVARDMEDSALLDHARRARTGKKFIKLFDEGDTSEFHSRSEADFALMNMLAFWTAGDAERMADLFETSALYIREKGCRYVRLSAENALQSYKGAYYQPRSTDKAREEEPRSEDPLTPYLEWLLDPSQWTGRKGASAFKTVCGIVCLVEESGVVDADGNVRIGSDTRRLAEAAGIGTNTLRNSALPHLILDMKVLKWRRGKKGKAGVFILKKPARTSCPNKVSTHFNGSSYAHPQNALDALRELARMRSGKSKDATLLRLGMPAMFVMAAMCLDPARGYALDELAEATGRRKRTLDSPSNPQSPIKRLKGAGIIWEISHETYRFSKHFGQAYQRNLTLSGICYAEQRQKERHRADKEAKRRRQHERPDTQPNNLKGKGHMDNVRKRNHARQREKWIEEQRTKVGMTATTFLDDELRGVVAVAFNSLKDRWLERGGPMRDLGYAINFGPFRKYREADGSMAVMAEDLGFSSRDEDSPRSGNPEARIKRLIEQGMSPKWARAEVLGESVQREGKGEGADEE
jgi:hypothetical protein